MLPYGYDELAKVTGDKKYADVKHTVTASYVNDDGTIRRYDKKFFNIDSVAPGRTILKLYEETKDPKFKKAAAVLRDQLTRPIVVRRRLHGYAVFG